ncbi:hypothetical protein [Rhodococcus jostii]|nr:hypothetical protein [Rhodococcus jostii]
MMSDLAVNLLDTFPGRMLIDWWGEWRALHPEFFSAGQYADSIDTEDYSGRVAMVLHMYLYGGDFKAVIDLDTSDLEVVEMSEAVAAALCSPSRETLLSPQSHHGNLTEFRTLGVANRHRPSALPDGAIQNCSFEVTLDLLVVDSCQPVAGLSSGVGPARIRRLLPPGVHTAQPARPRRPRGSSPVGTAGLPQCLSVGGCQGLGVCSRRAGCPPSPAGIG